MMEIDLIKLLAGGNVTLVLGALRVAITFPPAAAAGLAATNADAADSSTAAIQAAMSVATTEHARASGSITQRVLTWFTEVGEGRMAEASRALGLTYVQVVGAVNGLVAMGHLERKARGIYIVAPVRDDED